MTTHVSIFPRTFTLSPTPADNYGWAWVLTTDDGEKVFLTDEQADQLGALLWNRKIEEKAA